jgi:hypothetical protein
MTNAISVLSGSRRSIPHEPPKRISPAAFPLTIRPSSRVEVIQVMTVPATLTEALPHFSLGALKCVARAEASGSKTTITTRPPIDADRCPFT